MSTSNSFYDEYVMEGHAISQDFCCGFRFSLACFLASLLPCLFSGRSELFKMTVRVTTNGFKAIARKGTAAQEIFISTTKMDLDDVKVGCCGPFFSVFLPSSHSCLGLGLVHRPVVPGLVMSDGMS